MREGRIKNGQESELIVNQEHQILRDKLQPLKTVLKNKEVLGQVNLQDLDSQLDQANLVQLEVVPSSESKRRNRLQRKFKIKSSKHLQDFKATSLEEKPSLDATSVPNVIVM